MLKLIRELFILVFKNQMMFLTYIVLILLMVFLPLNTSGELNNMNIVTFRGDYFFHSLMFIPWAFFYSIFRHHSAWWLLIGLVFASLCEVVQYPLPYRSWNINDLFSNVLGVVLGFIAVNLFLKKSISIGQ